MVFCLPVPPPSHPPPALACRRQDASTPPELPTPSPAYQRLRRFLSERMRLSHIVLGSASRGWWAGCSMATASRNCLRATANAAAQAVAWQTPQQRALEVDHIVPRNQGGSDDLSNLQSLCFRCNAGKRWETRGGLCVLRAGGQRPGAAGERTGAVHRRCLPGGAWAQPVIPRRHGADGLALHQPEWNAVVDAGRRSRNQIRWAGTVRWRAARRPEPAWPASDHGWPASSARSHR